MHSLHWAGFGRFGASRRSLRGCRRSPLQSCIALILSATILLVKCTHSPVARSKYECSDVTRRPDGRDA